MEEIVIKERELNKKRLEYLKKDLMWLRNDTYQIIEVDYPKKEITIKGLLFDIEKLHCIYISPYTDENCLKLIY